MIECINLNSDVERDELLKTHFIVDFNSIREYTKIWISKIIKAIYPNTIIKYCFPLLADRYVSQEKIWIAFEKQYENVVINFISNVVFSLQSSEKVIPITQKIKFKDTEIYFCGFISLNTLIRCYLKNNKIITEVFDFNLLQTTLQQRIKQVIFFQELISPGNFILIPDEKEEIIEKIELYIRYYFLVKNKAILMFPDNITLEKKESNLFFSKDNKTYPLSEAENKDIYNIYTNILTKTGWIEYLNQFNTANAELDNKRVKFK